MKVHQLLILSCLMACSSMSKNLVQQGDLEVRDGVAVEKKWEGKINFKRSSWYSGLTLLYDLMLWRVEDGPFLNWFSAQELERRTKCGDYFVVVDYSYHYDTVSQREFLNQMKSTYGYEKVEIPTFKRNLELHPDMSPIYPRLYRIYGLCRMSGEKASELMISLPAFQQINVL